MKTSSTLSLGSIYSRSELAEHFGITDATLNTGIFQPAGHESVWLFVTERKTPDRTQYADLLEGDDLAWDGQTAGRKDALIIEHEAHGLELLLFYRKSKNQFGNYGFRYEGLFRYISHTGQNPAHFHLARVRELVPVATPLATVDKPEDVASALATFNREAPERPDRARSILNQTTYWVFNPQSRLFGPGKFVGYAGMTFAVYESGLLGATTGAKFDGHVTKVAIEAALDGEFIDSPPLSDHLVDWATALVGPNPFGNANPDKWQFILLGESEDELASDEVSVALEVKLAQGQGFVMDPALRKEIELKAMAAATVYFRLQGFTVVDVSANRPYDLRCTRGDEVVYAEVKGTQSAGEEVVLTAGEVAFARSHRESMALFILHSLEPADDPNQPYALSDGAARVLWPWDVDQGELRAISFRYQLPAAPPE